MKMKYVGIFVGLLGLAAIGSASPVSCGVAPISPIDVVNASPGIPSAVSFTCGGLTFSNFNAVDAGNTSGLQVNLVDATFDAATGWVVLSFNPNMTLPNEDMWFFYKVTGSILELDLTNNGSGNTSIFERGCSSPTTASGACSVAGTQLGKTDLIASGGSATVFSGAFPVTSPVYVYKDIQTLQGTGTTHLTSFSQSFHTPTVPEPVTFSLMGVGLLGLGLLRKRMR